MPSTELIIESVRRYLSTVESGTAVDIASCYSEDATVEDPVGTEPHRGRAAITQFYSVVESTRRKADLIAIRVAGASAAFHFRIRTETGAGTSEIDPIDIMTFDEDGFITGMRAFWGPSDIRTIR